MPDLDSSIADRWFDVAGDSPQPSDGPHRLSRSEQLAFAAGRRALHAALAGHPAEPPTRPTDRTAAVMQDYLLALAAGVAEARAANISAPGEAGPLDLVTGMIAGAAAIGGDEQVRSSTAGLAALLAHRAAMVATDAVLTGGDLTVAARAAVAGLTMVGLTAMPSRPTELRSAALLEQFVRALETAVRPVPSGPPFAGCGARPGETGGWDLLAEMTFTTVCDEPTAQALESDLAPIAEEVTRWAGGERHLFHVHSERPGAVIEHAYALCTPFDLRIRALATARRAG